MPQAAEAAWGIALRNLLTQGEEPLGVKRFRTRAVMRKIDFTNVVQGVRIRAHTPQVGQVRRLCWGQPGNGKKRPQVVFASCGRTPEGGACEFSLVVERELVGRGQLHLDID